MNIGPVHLQSGSALPYLALAYALFFVVLFTYMAMLSRRQGRMQEDLDLLQRALDDEKQRASAG